MPFAFQVITRVVLALVTLVIIGLALMYVDDIIGCSPKSAVNIDMGAVHNAVTGLVGDDVVAVSKNKRGVILDIIGWNFDLQNKTVTVSRRNLVKAIYSFFDFDIKDPISRTVVERMAFLAARISQLWRLMRPYTHALFACLRNYKHDHCKRVLPALAKVDVCVWRGFLVMSRADPINISRSITSYAARDASLGYEYDASLHTVAVGVFLIDIRSGRRFLMGYIVIELPYPATTDASF
jgi:hypothetical protein